MFFRLLTGRIEKATSQSAAFDLFYAGDKPIFLGDAPQIIPTGVRTAFDPRLVAIIKERSGLGSKGLEVKAGVIDADYRGEWGVVMRYPIVAEVMSNFHVEALQSYPGPFQINPGDKIAQFLLVEIPKVDLEAEPDAIITLKDAVRGEGGFGSSDKKS